MAQMMLLLCLLADYSLRSLAITRIRDQESVGVQAAKDSSVDVEVPLETGAACLDGTPYVFRLRYGDPKRWTMKIHSYGTCLDEKECYEMSQGEHGTSSVLDEDGCVCRNMDGQNVFDDCTCVDLFYCDGSWFASDRAEPIEYNGSKVYFRGKRNFEESFKILKSTYGMGNASDLAVFGDSSGGLATMVHLDDIAASLPGVKVLGFPVAGFTLDTDSCCSADSCCLSLHQDSDYCCYKEGLQTMYEVQNMSANKDCMAEYATNPWRCLYGVHAAAFTKTPMFIMNSQYDFWQLIHLDGLDEEGIRTQQAAAGTLIEPVRDYGTGFQTQLHEALDNSNHAAYISSCVCHASCAEGAESFWSVKTADGTPLLNLIGDWYANPTSSINGEFDIDPNYDCDITEENPNGEVLLSQRPITFRD